MKDKIIYLDADGVFINFLWGLIKAHGRDDLLDDYENELFPRDWLLEGELGDEKQLWKPVADMGEDFWIDLPAYPELDDIKVILKELEIPWYICTTPAPYPDSYSGKLKWIHKFFGDDFNRIIMMKDKYLLAHENAFLIDDNDNNCIKFEEHGGQTFTYPRSWNLNRGGIPYRIPLLRGSLSEWANESEFISGIRRTRSEKYPAA